MKKRKILFIILILFVNIVIIVVTHIISIQYYKYYGQYNGGDAKCVYKLPDGYISIENEKFYNDAKGILNWNTIFFPQIIFNDADNISIFVTYLDADWFIVRYKNEYYIDELMYDKLIYDANIIAEQRNRIYNMGEAVILRVHGVIPYVIIMNAVETESERNFEVSTIKFTKNPSISERKTIKIFDQIETDKGTIINKFVYINEETVQVKLPAGEKISMIVLKSPDHEGCIRKVRVE